MSTLPANHPGGFRDPHVETRVRQLTADQLGVDLEALSRDVSLVDDLAADSLDLVELALAIEDELGITLPETVLARVRGYGDLVDAIVTRVRARGAVPLEGEDGVLVRARITGGRGAGPAVLERLLRLTPYAAEVLVDDVVHAGPTARLELVVPAGTARDAVGALRARLRARGVPVEVRCEVFDPSWMAR